MLNMRWLRSLGLTLKYVLKSFFGLFWPFKKGCWIVQKNQLSYNPPLSQVDLGARLSYLKALEQYRQTQELHKCK
jgi:hypothetical protein